MLFQFGYATNKSNKNVPSFDGCEDEEYFTASAGDGGSG
jgi:hypothetical protein